MIVRELLTVIGFKVEDGGVKKAEDLFSSLKIGAAAVVAAAVGGVLAFREFGKQMNDTANDIALASQRLGLTAEQYQELAYAAETSGVGVEIFSKALRELNRRAADAGDSKEMAKAFGRAGIAIRDAHGEIRPLPDLLGQIADRIAKIKSPAERTKAAMDLLGRGGATMIPMLLEGRAGIAALTEEFRELGGEISNETIEAVKKLDDSYDRLEAAQKGVWTRLYVRLIPTFQRWTDATVKSFKANRQLIDGAINILGRAVEWVADKISDLSDVIDRNHEFFGILAVVLTARMIPALLRMALASVLALAPMLLFAAAAFLIALAIEEVYQFVKGDKKTALQDWIDVFTKAAEEPNANWIVKTISAIVNGIKDAIKFTNDLFKLWLFDEIEAGSALDKLIHGGGEKWAGILHGGNLPGEGRREASVFGLDARSMTPQEVVTSRALSSGVLNIDNSPTVIINAPGSDPEMLQRVTTQGVSDANGQMRREILRDVEGRSPY